MSRNKSTLMTSYVTEEDIDLLDKLDNMLGSEISEVIYEKCKEPKTFKKIEEKVWKLMKNSAEPFSKTEFYDGLAGEYDAKDEHDLKSAELYNCDLLYMVAIASVLGLERPRSSGDIEIFGM